MSTTTIVVSGGPLSGPAAVDAAVAAHLRGLDPPVGRIVAADSGFERAERLGLPVDDLIGDLDSISPAALDRARAAGVRIHEHPTAKDATDLELALGLASGSQDATEPDGPGPPTRIVVVGTTGGRLDHLLASVSVLFSPAWSHIRISALLDDHLVLALGAGATEVPVSTGATVSLLPVGGPAHVRRTGGLRWVLDDEVLDPVAGRGVANVAESTPVTVELSGGHLAVVVPGALGPVEHQPAHQHAAEQDEEVRT